MLLLSESLLHGLNVIVTVDFVALTLLYMCSTIIHIRFEKSIKPGTHFLSNTNATDSGSHYLRYNGGITVKSSLNIITCGQLLYCESFKLSTVSLYRLTLIPVPYGQSSHREAADQNSN